jgi:hypothetical protein
MERLHYPFALVLLRDPSGKRSPFALLCTDPPVAMLHIITWYVFRWNSEVTFLRSTRSSGPRHPATMEYGCQCSDHPLPGTGLFSLVVLMAHALPPDYLSTRQTAWDSKTDPPFADALAAVRRQRWVQWNSPTLPAPLGSVNLSEALFETLIEVACYAA